MNPDPETAGQNVETASPEASTPEAPKPPRLSHDRDSRTGMARIAISHAGKAGKVFIIGGESNLIPADEAGALGAMLNLPRSAKGAAGGAHLSNVFTGEMSEAKLKAFLVDVRARFAVSRNLVASGAYAAALAKREEEEKEARGTTVRKTRPRFHIKNTELL